MFPWVLCCNGLVGIRDANHLIGDIFVNAGNLEQNLDKWPADKWHRIDLTQYGIPVDAVAVEVTGRISITAGRWTGTAENAISFKKPSEPNSVNIHDRYCLQVLGNQGASHREIVTTTIIPENGLIDFGWTYQPKGKLVYPKTPSVGMNLVFKKWFK